MKKIFTSLFAAFAILANAQTTFDGSTLYGYCTSASFATGLNVKANMGVAMQLNTTTIRQFKGCKITAIAVANGVAGNTSSIKTLPISLFVGETLTETPAQSFTGEMDLENPYAYKEYPLTDTITIASDTPELFFGYKVECNPEEYHPVVTDGQADQSAGPGDYIGQQKDGSWVWAQLRSQIGMPCIRLKIEGDGLKANYVSMIEHHLPTYCKPGATETAGIYVRNTAYNTINNLNVQYTVNGEEHNEIIALPKPLLYNEHAGPIGVNIQVPDTVGNDLPLTITIAGVNNDVKNNTATTQRSASTTFLCINEGYDHAAVIEEATGTWCGYCPMGIVGLEKMGEAHKDDPLYIPIAAHNGDPMAAQSYSKFFESYYTGSSYPTFMMNRNKEQYGVPNPTFSTMEEAYQMVVKNPAVCSAAISEINYDAASKKITATAETDFVIPTDGDYAFSFVLTEDGVGPYSQTNYYSPDYGNGMSLEWWDEQDATVKNVYYDHVVRFTTAFLGTKGSLPAEITADTKYTHTGTLQTNTVKDINKCHLIVLIINRNSRRIENAARVSLAGIDGAAINEINAGQSNATDVYYDLQGRRVANPGHGVYIHNGSKILL